MSKKNLVAIFFGLLIGNASPAQTANGADAIAALAARITELERQSQRLREQAEQALAAAQSARDALLLIQQQTALAALPTAAADAADAIPAAVPAAAPTGANGNAFNPAISVVLNGTYAHHSLPPERYQRAGFPLVGEGGPLSQGLSLGESEIALSANVDDKFYGQVTLAVGSADGVDEIGIEESFIDALGLPGGISLRAGRFFSNIGYLNSHHAHTDSFIDRPLASQAFLGNQYFDDGVQLRWVAPTDLFIEVGGEVLRGQRFPGGGAGNGGVGSKTAFVHLGGDIGIEQSWLAGVSLLHTDAKLTDDGFSGNADLYIADATWKWAPRGNFKDGGLTLRGEAFLESRDGSFFDTTTATPQVWNAERWGAYLQGVYRLNRRWETGYRYDYLGAADAGPLASSFDPERHTLMLTWLNSEFSLMRLQLSHERPHPDLEDHAIALQYQVNLGAHGAHKF